MPAEVRTRPARGGDHGLRRVDARRSRFAVDVTRALIGQSRAYPLASGPHTPGESLRRGLSGVAGPPRPHSAPYLSQVEALIAKSQSGTLSTAEVVLLQKLDLAGFHEFQLGRDPSISLLKAWLTSYKFKDWATTETREVEATLEMKQERASWIAHQLNDHERWLTHGRGIDMRTLQQELNLKIEDFGVRDELKKAVWDYFWFLRDHMGQNSLASFVHTPYFF